MSARNLRKTAFATAAATAVAGKAMASIGPAVPTLIRKIKEGNDEERAEAWTGAWRFGAPAIKPLVELMTDGNFEVARAATRAIWKIVHHVGRPGADNERTDVIVELLPLLADGQPAVVRREAMWMLSEIAGDEAVQPVSALLKDNELREDARLVLERMPGDTAVAALKIGLNAVPDDFKVAIEHSLIVRGVAVPGHKCQKRMPTRGTNVKPLA